MKKTAPKNTKYLRNETILRMEHLAKAIEHVRAIDFAKMVKLGEKLKMPKTCEKLFNKNIIVVLCKKPLKTAPNIREMRRF